MAKVAVFLAVAFLTLLLACGAAADSTENNAGRSPEDFSMAQADSAHMAGTVELASSMAAKANPAQSQSMPSPASLAEEAGSVSPNLQSTLRKVIYLASVSVQVAMVEDTVTEIRGIAENLGGFVEQLSSSGEAQSRRANITVRVPQGEFFTALERIEALGKVRDRNVGSEDVSEEFIDLGARLKSSLRKEQSLLSLLNKATTVNDILTIERELFRVRSEIERFQGQLDFLERRVELATINIQLFPPKQQSSEPPSALLTIQVSDVSGSVDEIKALVSNLDGVLDRVFLSLRDENERADLSLRVFTLDFKQALASIESQGNIESKELHEAINQKEPDVIRAETPNAQIHVSFIGETGSGLTPWIVGFGGGGTAVILSFFYLAYRLGRRKTGQV